MVCFTPLMYVHMWSLIQSVGVTAEKRKEGREKGGRECVEEEKKG